MGPAPASCWRQLEAQLLKLESQVVPGAESFQAVALPSRLTTFLSW